MAFVGTYRALLSSTAARPSLSLNFLAMTSATFDPRITFSRGSQATLTDSTGKITYAPNNLLLNTATLSTQSVTTQAVSYILSFTGTGSITLSGAYSATLAGTGATNRVYLKFTSTAASLTLTVTGTVTEAQLEAVTYQTTPSTYVATTSAAYYGPRFDYDPVTLAAKGLLIEEARTNLALRSQEFDNAAWVKSRSTVTANATTSPDGTVNADKLVEDTSAGTHRTFQQVAKAASSLTRTFSVYLKAGERTFARVSVSDNTESVVARTDVNLSAGTVTAASVAGGSTISAASAAISNMGNGWYRVSLTATFDATITNPGAFVFVCDSLGGISYTGNGTSGIYVWGAQWEDGSFATSYIPTVASTVTRSADVATMTGANFSSWYNQASGTLVAGFTFAVAQPNFATLPRFVGLTDSAGLTPTSGTAITGYQRVGGVTQMQTALGSSQIGTHKAGIAYGDTDFTALNGIAGTNVAGSTAGNMIQFTLGIASNFFHNALGQVWLRAVTYYPQRLPNPTLQALTS